MAFVWNEKAKRSKLLAEFPGEGTKLYKGYGYDPGAADAFHMPEEIDTYIKVKEQEADWEERFCQVRWGQAAPEKDMKEIYYKVELAGNSSVVLRVRRAEGYWSEEVYDSRAGVWAEDYDFTARVLLRGSYFYDEIDREEAGRLIFSNPSQDGMY